VLGDHGVPGAEPVSLGAAILWVAEQAAPANQETANPGPRTSTTAAALSERDVRMAGQSNQCRKEGDVMDALHREHRGDHP